MLKKINNYHIFILILIVFILNTILFRSIDITKAQFPSPPGTPGEQTTNIVVNPLQEDLNLGGFGIYGADYVQINGDLYSGGNLWGGNIYGSTLTLGGTEQIAVNNGNLYYRSHGGDHGTYYSIRQVNYSNPKNIVATQITDDNESIENFVVDSEGNVAYNTLPSTNNLAFWIGFDGKIKTLDSYNTDVNLTSDYYKLYSDDKLIIFDPMGNGKYIIDNGEELETKDLTNSLLIDFLLEIKCKHTFECSTQ